jgi:hypothetical protein
MSRNTIFVEKENLSCCCDFHSDDDLFCGFLGFMLLNNVTFLAKNYATWMMIRKLMDILSHLNNMHNIPIRAVWKVTFIELLTKQAVRKTILYTKNMHILKLLLNVVTTRIATIIISYQGISFYCLCTEPCSHTFHQLFIIAEALCVIPASSSGR